MRPTGRRRGFFFADAHHSIGLEWNRNPRLAFGATFALSMEIKIECGCGTKYKFEVEPVHGRMPVQVTCPGCGADGATDANQILAQKVRYNPALPPATGAASPPP